MTRKNIGANIDVIASIAGILLGVAISCTNFFSYRITMATMGPVLVIGCLLYLTFRRKLLALKDSPQTSTPIFLITTIAFWLLFALSIYTLNNEALYRPVIYFVLTSLDASMIALQIMYSNHRNVTCLILLEILLVSLSVRASAFWVFPTLPGSDPWEHAVLIRDFVNLGHIGSTTGQVYYLSYPVMHLDVTFMNLVTGVDYKAALFFGASLPLILSTVFIFLAGRTLVSSRVGLMATLLINFTGSHIQWSVQIIAMSLAAVPFVAVLYLMIRDKIGIRVSTVALAIFFLLILIITHTVTSFVMFIFILAFLIGAGIYIFIYGKNAERVRSGATSIGLLSLFGISMISYWMYTGYLPGRTFFDVIVRSLDYSFTSEAGFLVKPGAEIGGIGAVLDSTGQLILIFFGVIGCILWLSDRHRNRITFGWVSGIIILVALTYLFPLFGMKNIMPDRWYLFTGMLLSVLAAFALLTIVDRIAFCKVGIVLLLCTVFGFSFFMTTSGHANMDSPIYAEGLTPRVEYTNSEMAIGEKMISVYAGEITTDTLYGSSVLQIYMGESGVNSDMLDEERLERSLVIWRDIMAERPVSVQLGPSYDYMVLGQGYEEKLEGTHNLIYINNTSKAFLPRGK